MKNSELRDRAKILAIQILATCDTINARNGRGVLINQIVKSVTSIGANLHEANYGASRADFVNKLQIALKECYETEYWLDMLQAVDCINEQQTKTFLQDCGILRRMLVKAINTAKENL